MTRHNAVVKDKICGMPEHTRQICQSMRIGMPRPDYLGKISSLTSVVCAACVAYEH